MAQLNDTGPKASERTESAGTTAAASDERETDRSNGTVPVYRNPRVIIPLVLVLGVIGFVSWRYYVDARDYISTDDAYIDGNRVAVSSKILGGIDTLFATEGDTVRAGQTLVRLNGTDLLAQEAAARA